MSHNSKIILRYSQYKPILDTYLSLLEFQEKAAETMRGKRVTITSLCNYLGDLGVTSFQDRCPQNVTGFMDSLSKLSASTKSGKLFILWHFLNYLYDEKHIIFSGKELFPVIVSNKRDRILSFYCRALTFQMKTIECLFPNIYTANVQYLKFSIVAGIQ